MHRGEESKVVHRADDAATFSLRKATFGHRRELGIGEAGSRPSRAENRARRSANRLQRPSAAGARARRPAPGSLVDEQRDLRTPEQHGRVPVPERVVARRLDRRAHPARSSSFFVAAP